MSKSLALQGYLKDLYNNKTLYVYINDLWYNLFIIFYSKVDFLTKEVDKYIQEVALPLKHIFKDMAKYAPSKIFGVYKSSGTDSIRDICNISGCAEFFVYTFFRLDRPCRVKVFQAESALWWNTKIYLHTGYDSYLKSLCNVYSYNFFQACFLWIL